MTDEEIEKKAEEKYKNLDECRTKELIIQAYLDGLAEGRKEKWHDLRKNPNDLPETSIYLSNYSDVVLRQDGVQVRYVFEAGEWIFESRSFYERCEVIAWCEKPKFEE